MGEGLRRIATVVRWFGYLVAVVLVGAGFSESLREGMVAFLAVAIVVSVLGWILAWIIDGFVEHG